MSSLFSDSKKSLHCSSILRLVKNGHAGNRTPITPPIYFGKGPPVVPRKPPRMTQEARKMFEATFYRSTCRKPSRPLCSSSKDQTLCVLGFPKEFPTRKHDQNSEDQRLLLIHLQGNESLRSRGRSRRRTSKEKSKSKRELAVS